MIRSANLAAVSKPSKASVKKIVVTVLLASIGLHIAVGIIAGIIVVARYLTAPPAEFQAVRDVRLPAKKREHRMNMAAMDALAPKPTFSDKMQSSRPAAFSLPELPSLPLDQMLPLDPAQIVSDQASSLGSADAMGAGSGSGGTAGGGAGFGKGLSFLGVQSEGQRILLLFDVSSSVTRKAAAAGIPLEKIQEETLALIDKLPPTSRFGIVQFTQNYKPFLRELVPASDSQREAARQWVRNEWVTVGTMGSSSKVTSNPRGLVGVLDLAAQMKPDVLFIISDGSFQWKPDGSLTDIPWPEIEKICLGPLRDSGCKVHFIAFQAEDEDFKKLRSLSSRTGGKAVELKR